MALLIFDLCIHRLLSYSNKYTNMFKVINKIVRALYFYFAYNLLLCLKLKSGISEKTYLILSGLISETVFNRFYCYCVQIIFEYYIFSVYRSLKSILCTYSVLPMLALVSLRHKNWKSICFAFSSKS